MKVGLAGMRWILFAAVLAGCVDFDAGALPTAPASGGGNSGSGSGTGSGSGPGSGSAAVKPHVANATAVFAGSASAYSVPIPSSAPGTTIIIGVALETPNAKVSGITDNTGSVYESAQARASWSLGATEIWYAQQRSAGVTTVSFALDSASASSLWILEVTGIDPSPPDWAKTDNMSAGPQIAAPPVTTFAADAFVVSVVNVSTGALTGIHAGSPFQELPYRDGNDAAFIIPGIAGTYAADWDASTSGACASTAAFAAATM